MRRNFSLRVVHSDKFLKMPLSAQALYFHICIDADSFGQSDGYAVQVEIGASGDDFDTLIRNGFIEAINGDDGDVQVLDWCAFNRRED